MRLIIFETLQTALEQHHPVTVSTVVEGPGIGSKLLVDADGQTIGSLGDDDLDALVRHDALDLLDAGQNDTRRYQTASDAAVRVLIETYPAPPHLVVVGGVHIAIPLTSIAKLLGFRVTVIDPRTAFLTPDRFPHADALIAEWPDDVLPDLNLNRSTAVAILTHDPKLDNPATLAALRYPVRYLGAIGSPKTQARRRDELQGAGVSDADIARIHGPIGLPIGAATPAEIAISIMAEIVAVWRGKHP